jgi:hydroxyethylthiazole kinase-like uncharacterized protein yjeF
MKIISVDQLRAWDAYTILHEPIASVDLMERAATTVVDWITAHDWRPAVFAIFCGRGNNGGDGLAIARQLLGKGHDVQVYLLASGNASPDHETNLKRAEAISIPIHLLNSEADFPQLAGQACVLDALFGTGLNRPLEGLAAALVQHINSQEKTVISIDMPSGLLADEPTPGNNIIKANYTLAFQCPRLAFMMPESEQYTGKWEILDIGLSKDFQPESSFEWVLPESPWLQLYRLRKHAHKGMLGHVLISAGSIEKMGAAVMCAKACLRSGSGLLTMAVPEECFAIIQTTTPEAMCRPQDDSANEFFLQNARINSVALGPGWPTYEGYLSLLEEMIVKVKCPLVIDASGLFHLSHNTNMLALRPHGADTIITPHGGEFARMFGTFSNSFQRMQAAIEKARELNVFIVLKGAYTQVITPGGQSYFNSTGNPGMAKGGSGDVLTGIISSLLAQQYPTTLACILAVYVHGLAGDYAAQKFTRQGMTAMDIVQCLPKAWKKLAAEE